MTYYIIQSTQITDNGTITRYYSDSKNEYECTWTDYLENAKFFKTREYAMNITDMWNNNMEEFCGFNYEIKEVSIYIMEENKEHNCHNCGHRSSFSFGDDYGCEDALLFSNPCVNFNNWIPKKEDDEG